MSKIKLAVYGTLKSTHRNHSILGDDAVVLARNVRIPGYSLYELGWYPGIVKDPDGAGVECEIVEVPTMMVGVIDQYEGYAGPDLIEAYSLFVREVVTLENGDNVLIYVYNGPMSARCHKIESGRWEDSLSVQHGANYHG